MRTARRIPWRTAKAVVTGNSLCYFDTPALVREAFYSAGVPDDDVAGYGARLQNESVRVALDGLFLNLPKPKRVTTPMLVLGGALDRCFTQKEVRATARAYGTEAVMFPGMAHNVMLEPDWAAVAEHIHAWLGDRGL
jgi:pimeloyl-ACP methyl ester carboxylesterase